MSILNLIFGEPSKYSKIEHQLSADKIKVLVSQVKVRSLSQAQEALIEQEIMARRRGDGKISLFQICEVLTKLQNQHKISPTDKEGLVKVFKIHFGK